MSEAVAKFAEQFVEMEAENDRLRKNAAEAEKMAEEAWQENDDLKKELDQVKADLAKEVEVRETLKREVDKRDARLRKSIESLLGKLLLIFALPILLDELLLSSNRGFLFRCCRHAGGSLEPGSGRFHGRRRLLRFVLQ